MNGRPDVTADSRRRLGPAFMRQPGGRAICGLRGGGAEAGLLPGEVPVWLVRPSREAKEIQPLKYDEQCD